MSRGKWRRRDDGVPEALFDRADEALLDDFGDFYGVRWPLTNCTSIAAAAGGTNRSRTIREMETSGFSFIRQGATRITDVSSAIAWGEARKKKS